MSVFTLPLIIYSVAVQVIIAGLLAVGGVVIAYQGYRGYVRNNNRTLLLLTVGIQFLTTIPVVVEGIFQITDVAAPSYVSFVTLSFTILGLIVILYAFTRT